MLNSRIDVAPIDDVHRRVTRARAALARGREALFAQQRADGSYEDPIDVGPVCVATQLVLERFCGRLSARDAEEGARALGAAQREDGSFPAFPNAPSGSAAMTALAIAALDAAGIGPTDGRHARAKRALESLGGMPTVVDGFRSRGDVTPLFLAAAGACGSDFLPHLPLAVALAPGLETMTRGRVHAGNLMALFTVLALGDRLRRSNGPASTGLLRAVFSGALRGVERFRAAGYLGAWQNPGGGFNESVFATQLMALGLAALDDRERCARALGWLDRQKSYGAEGLRMQAIPNDVWSTAMALLGLLEGGASRQDPRVLAAVGFLVREQHRTEQPLANQRRRGAKRIGGWAFQRGNPTMPDCDDTGLVLAALGTFAQSQTTREVFAAIDDGVGWLRDMQNPDGGWGAYVWDLPGKKPGPMFLTDTPMPSLEDPRAVMSMFFEPPAELGDPSTEGVAARVLMGLGASGVRRDDPMVARSIAFLTHQQCESGAWWDRWMTCYLPGTATVLLGLAAVGEDLRAPYVVRALDWMRAQQNADGGFGETSAAFRDPTAAGRGPSMPPVTAFVASALVAADPRADEVERAIDYLLDAQDDAGTWDSAGWVNPYVPPDTFYAYDLPARSMPLMALGRYLGAVSR